MNRRLILGGGLALIVTVVLFVLWMPSSASHKPADTRRDDRTTTRAGAEAGRSADATGPGAREASSKAAEGEEADLTTVGADGTRPAKAGSTAAELHLPGLDTAAELQVPDLCASLAKDRRNLQTSLNMIELLPESNQETVGAKRLHFIADRLDRSVQRKAALANKRGLACPEG